MRALINGNADMLLYLYHMNPDRVREESVSYTIILIYKVLSEQPVTNLSYISFAILQACLWCHSKIKLKCFQIVSSWNELDIFAKGPVSIMFSIWHRSVMVTSMNIVRKELHLFTNMNAIFTILCLMICI